jgi:hypothetical protein
MKNIVLIPNENADKFEQDIEDIGAIDNVVDTTYNMSQICYEFEFEDNEIEKNTLLEIIITQNK